MPRAQTEPTIPTDQEAVLAREASRALDASTVPEGALHVRLRLGQPARNRTSDPDVAHD